MRPLIERLLRAWNPPWGFYRLSPKGKFIRTLWAGPLLMVVIFVVFYIPCHLTGVPIVYPIMTPAVLLYPWLRQLYLTRLLWKQSKNDLISN